MDSLSTTEIRADGTESPNLAIIDVSIPSNVGIRSETSVAQTVRGVNSRMSPSFEVDPFRTDKGITDRFPFFENRTIQPTAEEFLDEIFEIHFPNRRARMIL